MWLLELDREKQKKPAYIHRLVELLTEKSLFDFDRRSEAAVGCGFWSWTPKLC
jgi:hypothetical protein